MANRLSGEKSPYLLQHASNPVDWLPWGEEAFALARETGRPIFLSIGYATCHWCHVMAHESFEDPEAAAVLNAGFIPVKVDREERPDLDRVYMGYVQAVTGHGGWPLSVWLTPELKPFYGGTYFPPADAHGRPGFQSILKAIGKAWGENRAGLEAEAARVIGLMREQSRAEGGESQPWPAAAEEDRVLSARIASGAPEAFDRCLEELAGGFDRENGGFGGAPKFPRCSNLSFLFRCAGLQGLDSDNGRESVRMASETLRAMARGGIHDAVGGGFHRYSVDAAWFVPHFEKMLYDQAQIAVSALEAWQATGDERHAWLARDILDYAARDLRSPQGGFHSAEDADSGDAATGRKSEGAFYLWTPESIRAVLGAADAELVLALYGVQPEGNVPPGLDPHGEFTGRNILAQRRGLVETATALGMDPEDASARLVRALEAMREARAGRPRPLLDDKVLVAWNGLMISALARAGSCPAVALEERRGAYLGMAVAAARFIGSELHDPASGRLFRSWRGTRGRSEGFAEDYACLIQGLLDLYEATFSAEWLRWAERLQLVMDGLFWDEERGGYFNSAADAPDVVVRLKEDYDGAEPAPSSIAALNLLRLHGLLGAPKEGPSHRIRALRSLAHFQPRWQQAPQALPQMLCAVEAALEAPRHLVIAGDPGRDDFQALCALARSRLGRRRTLIGLAGGPDQAWLVTRSPWLAHAVPIGGRATAYLCEEFACQAPVTEPSELAKML
jgi:uncharacterized protein